METRAPDWFERYWCGPIKGRWLLANGGIAIMASLATIKAWNQRGVGIAWPTAKDIRCVGTEWGGLGKEWGDLGKVKTDLRLD